MASTAEFRRCGRGSGIRTRDPLLPKQVLYLAELCPDTTVKGCVPRCGGLVKRAVWQKRASDQISQGSTSPAKRFARGCRHFPPAAGLPKMGWTTSDPGLTS